MTDCQQIEIHGHRVSYRLAGDGPVLLLLHGITGSSQQWLATIDALAGQHTVLAPDLLGHGESAKPRGDYSLGAHAAGVRDLMVGLGYRRATVVGHSLGGGIAMQMAYQFPERCERLALISSGGLGEGVHPLLRAASLPGSELILPLISNERVRATGAWLGELLERLRLRPNPDLAEIARGYGSLADPDAREAFLHTLRSVIDVRGQRISATDRLYLAAVMPTLIVWGERDPIIPPAHGIAAHEAMPGSRLELLAASGHFPHLDDPLRTARILADFIETTEPAEVDPDALGELIAAGGEVTAAV